MINVKKAFEIAKEFILQNEETVYLTYCKEFSNKYVFSFVDDIDEEATCDGTNIEVYKEDGKVDYYEFLERENMKLYAKAKTIKLSTFKKWNFRKPIKLTR